MSTATLAASAISRTDTVQLELNCAVATLRLNRPERLNAMTPELLDGMLHCLEHLAERPELRVVVLTGAGRGFCAGGDLSERPAIRDSDVQQVADLNRAARTSLRLSELPQVTIAAVNGACAGAGLAWAAACDLRLAAARAVFTTAYLQAGLPGDFGGTCLLSRILGPARAREWYLLPRKVSAQEARSCGLVSRMADDALFPALVDETTARLAASAPLALRAIKENFADAQQLELEAFLDAETARHVAVRNSHDAGEAARAFLEKRAPTFAGA